jgi:molecular chaperone GrpE (heat shock protein)
MNKFVVLAVLVALALSGCASGNFLGFIATNQYVDTKTKALADKQAAEIADLKTQLAENKALLDQAKAAVDQMNETQKAVADLQALAKRAEARIASIPKDVIKRIVDTLQASLDQ